MARRERGTRQALLPALLLGGLLLPGCGGGGTSGKKPPVVDVKGVDYAYVMKDTVPAGVSTFNVSNAGKKLHEFALGRLAPGHTVAELKTVLDKGQEPPSWAKDVAGVPALSPGERVGITRRLEPGNYAFICFIPEPFPNGKPHYKLGMIRGFRVTGDSGAKLPKADAVVTARQRTMDVPALKAGRQTIELRNAATRQREFELMSLRPGKTENDVQAWQKGGFKGQPPLVLHGAMQSIPPGSSVFLDVTLKSGRTYLFQDEENKIRKKFTVG